MTLPPTLPRTDADWHACYPPQLRAAAADHFAPLAIANRAAAFLAERLPAGRAIVDLGAGAGKFCVAAAARHPGHSWTGVERRAALVAEGERWVLRYGLANCRLLRRDIAGTPLSDYAGAFAYNPFLGLQTDDDALGPQPGPTGIPAFRVARAALHRALATAPAGFTLVTYYCEADQVPGGFSRAFAADGGRLVGWVRD